MKGSNQSPAKIVTEQTIHGFLLSRQWQDTAQGLVIEYWASSDIGPILIRYTGQQAVCFCRRSAEFGDPSVSTDGVYRAPAFQRRERDLHDLDNEPVDALYFDSQRALREFADVNGDLLETDIGPANRFLMERFVMASFKLHGEIEPAEVNQPYSICTNPRLAPAEYTPTLSAASLDIETNGFTNELYSIAIADEEQSIVFMRSDVTPALVENEPAQSGYGLQFCTTEKDLLLAFLHWFAERDPDLIIGWNVIGFDLFLLQNKCEQFKLPFNLGRASKKARILPRDAKSSAYSGPARARIPGRAVLDGVDLLKAGFWSFESFSLDNVASAMLGKKKTINVTGRQKVEEINRQFADNKLELASYNIQDCWLVQQIFEHADLFNFAIKRAEMTGLELDRMGGSVATFDNLYLPRLHRHGVVANDVLSDREGGLGSPGGYVLDSEPGLYQNILVLDFKSLYPSIIRTFLIDPLGLHQSHREENPVDGFLGAKFSRQQSILPDLVGELWQQRDMAKRNDDKALSQAIKIIMNSLYGVLGTPACRFYDPLLASSITLRGHQIIQETREQIEQQHHYKVIYGDTDSVFVQVSDDFDEARAQSAGERLAESLNSYWQARLKDEFNLPSFLEVEFETLYLKFVMPTIRGASTGSKKRYAGLIRNADSSTEVVFKGLEAARTDWTPLAREFQRELYSRIFHEQEYADWIKTTADDLRAGKLDHKLVYRKRLRRPLESYQKNVPPHIKAARQLEQTGNHIDYLITRSGPQALELATSAPDYEHYIERQLAPAADGLLSFLGTSFDTITSQQLSIF